MTRRILSVLAIIFAETGLLLGFFLPGDSLLVAAGIFSSASVAQGMGIEPLSFPVLVIGTPLCAIAGAQLGHFLGMRFGRKMFDKPDSRLFKREHVVRAEEFFEKFGPAVGTGEEGAPVAIWISALTLIAIGILATGLALYQYVGMVRYLWRPEFHDVAGARKRPVFTGAPVVAMFIGLSGIAALLVLLLSR